jgi:hypothetical protein
MDFATYWLLVPLVGIGLTLPVWVWLLLARHHHTGHPTVRGGE